MCLCQFWPIAPSKTAGSGVCWNACLCVSLGLLHRVRLLDLVSVGMLAWTCVSPGLWYQVNLMGQVGGSYFLLECMHQSDISWPMSVLQVRRREIPSGSIIRMCLKIDKICRLFWDIFSSEWFDHDFCIQAQDGCQMRWSAVKLDQSGKVFGTPPADWVHGYLYFELGTWISTKGFLCLSAYCGLII